MGEIRLSMRCIKKKIQTMLEEKRPDNCVSIYQAPLVLTEKNEEAYIPKWVSIGPYHHDDPHLSSYMCTQKVRAVYLMIQRLSPNIPTFEEIVKEIKKYERKIKESYQTDILYDGEDLACMMVLEGCFVLEILRCLSNRTPNDDPFFNRHNIEYANYSLLTDILLLENQIPLFVLIKLLKYEMETDREARTKLCEMLIRDREVGRLFYPFIFEEGDWGRQVEAQITEEPAHLLDLAFQLARGHPSKWRVQEEEATEPEGKYPCFNSLCKRRSKEENDNILTIPTATELRVAGIQFKACEGGLTKVRFRGETSTLELPKINVSDSVGIFLQNLMAYEIYDSPQKRVISNFAVLMDELINTEADVALLRQCNIIHSYTLGSDKDVATFFNNLRRGAAGAGSSSADTFIKHRTELLRCYRRKYRVMFVEFVRLHFSKPWRTASVAAAVVLLILTIVQTIYAIKGD